MDKVRTAYPTGLTIGVIMSKKINQTATNHRFVISMPRLDKDAEKHIDLIQNQGFGWAGGCFGTLGEEYAVTHALYSWYVEHNLAAAKQWFYVAAKLIAISSTKPVGNENFWAVHPFMFPLLSDSPEMIALYSTIETPNLLENRLKLKANEFDIYLVQTALQGDYNKLAELVDTYKAKNYKTQTKYKISMMLFMEGLMSGNISKMETAIAKHKNWVLANPITEDFLSDYGVTLCKLAWIKGFEVQVDSLLIPMEFMPVTPLAHYEDIYEFMKPNWIAPLQPPKPSDMSWDDYCRIEHRKKMIEDKIIKPPFIGRKAWIANFLKPHT
jgi:hypothetical protein